MIDKQESLNDEMKKISNLFCIGIASKDMMRKEIDNVFNKNKILYLKQYKNSSLYKSDLNHTLDYTTEIYTEKMIGIMEYSLHNDECDLIFELYKKAYRRFYNNIKDARNLSIDFLTKIVSSGVAGNYEYVSTYFIYKIKKNVFRFDDYTENLLEILISRTIVDMTMINDYATVNFREELLNSFKEEISNIKNKLGIKNKIYTFDMLLDDILVKDMNTYNKKITTLEEVDINRIQKIGYIGKYIGAMEGVFKLFKLDTGVLTTITKISPKEINEIIFSFILCKKLNHFTDEDLPSYISSLIYFKMLEKQYKLIKDDYIKNINEEHLLEIDSIEQGLMNSKIEINKLKEEKSIIEKSNKSKENEYIGEIERLKKENKQLKKDLCDMPDLKYEVIKLRNIVFNDVDENYDEENNQNDVNSLDIEQIVKLDKLNAVIIGGNLSSIKKIKDYLPSWTFIGMEQLNRDLQSIKGYDYVFINIKMKHSLYRKVKSILVKNNMNYNYINAVDNTNKILTNLYTDIFK